MITLLGASAIFGYGVKITRALPGKIPALPFLLGVIFILSGILVDVIATVLHSPDLKQEANPLVILFFDLGFSLKQIYALGLFGQCLYLGIFTTLWASFLKVYPILLNQLSFMGFIPTTVALFGGPSASKVDLLIGRVNSFFFITSMTPIFLALTFYRWYLALEWFGLAPISRSIIFALIMISSIVGFSYFSCNRIKKLREI